MQKIGVVIPCYNEEDRLNPESFNQFISSYNMYFIFVDDGSKDNTLNILNSIKTTCEHQVKILKNNKNIGKAASIRKGILALKELDNFDIVGYLDADLATPLNQIELIIKELNNQITFSFGSRFKRIGSVIDRKTYRHIGGRIIATIVSNMLGIGVYDTQCGAKFFNSTTAYSLFEKELTTTWIFDVELFFRFQQLNACIDINHIAREVPLTEWRDIGSSKINATYFLRLPFELLKLNRYRKITKKL